MATVEKDPQRLKSESSDATARLTVAPGQPERKKRLLKRIAIAIAVLIALPFAIKQIYNLMTYETTDDAYLEAHVHTISSRIVGHVIAVPVLENQYVKKGDVLVRLDDTDYVPGVKQAQASLIRAKKDVYRFRGFGSHDLNPTDRKALDEYEADAAVNDAKLNQARLQYEYTNITAPTDGKLGPVTVETGDQISAGQALMPLLEPHPWVEANFKEGQLARMHIGQPAEVTVDAIPGKVFKAHIDSIAPGSGSIFSILPPDNATGNFTKVVQRIPVKVTIDPDSSKGYDDKLVSGMSAEVRFKIQ